MAARGALEIRRPWIRPNSANPAQAGAFLTVTNTGTEPDRLVGATSPAVESVEIWAIKVVGPGIRMAPLEGGLALHAGTAVTLKPRGYHLLLQGLKAAPGAGARVPVTVVFEKAGSVELEFAVEEPGQIGEDILDEDRQPG